MPSQSGAIKAISTFPACTASPAAIASSTRSSRSLARPRDPVTAARVPAVFDPAVMSVPGSGRLPETAATGMIPRARRAAMLHPRDDLLADIAPLGEIHPAIVIHQRLVREGFTESVVRTALGHAEAHAMGLVIIARRVARRRITPPSRSLATRARRDADRDLRQVLSAEPSHHPSRR